MSRRAPVLLVLALAPASVAFAQPPASAPTTQLARPYMDDEGELDERPKKRSQRDDLPGWHYASKGLQFRSADGRWFQWFTLRNQFRLSSPFDGTPASADDIPADGDGTTELVVNRSRVKFGGHLGSRRVQDAFEIDLKHTRMYHFFTTVTVSEWLSVRAGQWKVEFNRERVDSSGDQQFVDRSIVNESFTLDGQLGVQARGRLFKGRAADSNYFLGVLAGEGRLAGNDDGVPMVLARYQWNPFRRTVGFSQGDVEYHPKPAMTVGVAAVRGRGRYTRYTSDGGAQLEGFAPGEAGQYELRQWMTDVAFFRRGVSVQGEHHWKRVIDHLNGGGRNLRGGYLQSGVFPVRGWSRVLSALEVGARIAYVDPDLDATGDLRREVTGVVNWYVNQHRNKITFDVSRLRIEGRGATRVRLQWDLSI